MKPWDEMTEEERVEWHRQHGATMTPEEAGGIAEGLLQNPEMLAEVERLLAQLKARKASEASPPAPDGEQALPNPAAKLTHSERRAEG